MSSEQLASTSNQRNNKMSSSKATRISLSPYSTNSRERSSRRSNNKVCYNEDDNHDDDDDDDESVSWDAPTEKDTNPSSTKSDKKKKNSHSTVLPNHPPPTPLPNHWQLRTIEEAIVKSDKFVSRTEKFIKKNYNQFNVDIKSLAKEFVREMWPIISGLCTKDDTGNNGFPVDGMVSPESELLGIYILWLHEYNHWKVGCVVGKSRDLFTRTTEQIDPQWDVSKYALIAMTLPKLRKLADANPMIWDYVNKFINIAVTFNVYEDHEEENKDEVLTFLMEHVISCCLKGVDPGYILERFIMKGSPGLTKYLSRCSSNQTVANELSIFTRANSHGTVIQTWETYEAAIRDRMLEVLNKLELDGHKPESILQLEALMEALFPLLHRKGRYMKRQVGLHYLWKDTELPIDIIDALHCPIFADADQLALEVTELMDRISDDYDGTFENIRTLFESFTAKHKKTYVPPDPKGDLYRDAVEKVLADVLDSARKSKYTQELIEVEAHMFKVVTDKIKNYYLSGEELSVLNPMGEVAGTLFKTTHGKDFGKTIMIFVTAFSPFAPYQHCAHHFSRVRGVSNQCAVADTRAEAGLILQVAAANFRGMMSSSLINIEPPNYDYTAAPKLDEDMWEEEMLEGEDDGKGTFNICYIQKAFPVGYLQGEKQVGQGVAALASIIHPGMLDLHAAALMAAMEPKFGFASFLLKYCQIDITPPVGMHSKEELLQFFARLFIKSRILWGIAQTRSVVNTLSDKPDQEELEDAVSAIVALEDDKRMKADHHATIRKICGEGTRVFSFSSAMEVLAKEEDDVQTAKLRTLAIAFERALHTDLVSKKYEDSQGFPGGFARLQSLCDDDFESF